MNRVIWHPKVRANDPVFIKGLRDLGFNGLVVEPSWDVVSKANPGKSYEELQLLTAQDMRAKYEVYKSMGFTYFLNLGSGWGLGKFDGNYFFKVIGDIFLDCKDVLFDVGEFYEDWVENAAYEYVDLVTKQKLKRKLTLEEYNSIIAEKRAYFGKRLELGNTRRNKARLGSETLTSYEWQLNYWTPNDPFVWMFGQLAYHFFTSLNYQSHYDYCKKVGIDTAILYQCDTPGWNWICFMGKIQEILGIREEFEQKRRVEFVTVFK